MKVVIVSALLQSRLAKQAFQVLDPSKIKKDSKGRLQSRLVAIPPSKAGISRLSAAERAHAHIGQPYKLQSRLAKQAFQVSRRNQK